MAKNNKRSGNPKKRAEALAATAVLRKPCIHCGKREASTGGLWCPVCADSARKRGTGNRPTAAMVRACVAGLAVELGLDTTPAV